MSSTDEIKTRLGIVELAESAGVKLRRSGKTYTGFCPFHSNTKTPAFVIWPDSGTWRCFGECGEGGDIFKFVMKKEGVDFKDALQILADRTGVKLVEYQSQPPEQKEEYQRLRNLLEEAATFYRHQLLSTPEGEAPLTYLMEKRKLTRETIEKFSLGYAPHHWDSAVVHFKTKGYTEHDLLEVGLVSERESGGYYDKFRNRIMIPIRDENGKMTGFGARILDPNDIPKFMNSPQTVLFDKSSLLFGLDQARKSIRAQDQGVIVEGYLDVIALHQAGFSNVVSPMGTSITETQIKMLKKFTRKLVLALDPDSAGQKAVLRGLESARSSMDTEDEIRFDARGLLRHEGRLNADLRVATMPDGLDPDEVVEKDPALWASLISTSKPIVEYVLDVLIRDQDVNDPKTKSSIVSKIIPLIEDLPDPIERDAYRQLVARKIKVDERSLLNIKVAEKRTPPSKAAAKVDAQKANNIENPLIVKGNKNLEISCMNVLLRRPDLLPHIDRKLQESRLERVSKNDFDNTEFQLLLELIQRSLEQDEVDQVKFVENNLTPSIEEAYTLILTQKLPVGQNDRLIEEMVRMIINIRQATLKKSLEQISFLMNEPENLNETKLASLSSVMQQYGAVLRNLDDARHKLTEFRRK